jgi:hypothetical protein
VLHRGSMVLGVVAGLTIAVLGWCWSSRVVPPPEPRFTASHGACGLTIQTLREQDSTKQMPSGVLAWPTLSVPEFQDDQRFTDGSGPSRRFGPIACVIAHPSLVSYTDIDFAQTSGVWVAAIYVGATPAIATNDPYDDLGLRAGWNCLYMRSQGLAGVTMRGLVVQPDDEGNCRRQSSWVGRPAHRSPITATSPAHYPPVARFVEKKNTWRVGIGVKCVARWCNYGINAPPDVDDLAHPVGSTASPTYARRAVLGWHDQQHLLIGAVTSSGTGGKATIRSSIVPVHNLETFRTSSHFSGITNVAEIYFPDNDVAGTKYATGWGFSHSGTTPDTLALQLRAGQDPHLTSSWRVFVNSVEKANLKVRYTNHSTIFNPNPYIPGTARWRWKDGDEAIWVRCLDGCCEVDM